MCTPCPYPPALHLHCICTAPALHPQEWLDRADDQYDYNIPDPNPNPNPNPNQEWLERADDQYDHDESQRAEAAAKEARLRDTAWLRAEARPALEKRATSDSLSPAGPKPTCDRTRSDVTRLRIASR